MGNTTIIEIDHDQTQEIENDKEGFVGCVLEQCRAATHTGQRIPGGKVIVFFHRSGAIDEAWEAFKKTWGTKGFW